MKFHMRFQVSASPVALRIYGSLDGRRIDWGRNFNPA
jgi:hypothetical protein